MTKETRIKEIINAMPSFSKETYYKEELLPEYLELQNELINLTFNGNHAENGKLRIWDVENHLEKLNEKFGHIADEELAVFMEDSKFICNAIKSEVSGNNGEYKAFHCLEMLRCNNKVIKNIELRFGNHRAEIDAIVFTEKAIFIIEVKNSHRDIYIDERGNYYRVGNNMNLDCNIGEKMNEKIYLLREALNSSGYYDVNIVSLVVFTNSAMHVDNRYDCITTCFLSNLPRIIESYDGKPIYDDKSISVMMEGVANAECKNAYPLEIDINRYKRRFATLMAMLEEASEKNFEDSDIHETTIVEAYLNNTSNETPERSQSIKKLTGKIHSNIGVALTFGVLLFITSRIFNSAHK